MSEVKRYARIGDLVEATPGLLKLYPAMTVYVLGYDFDCVTAERDALQQRLTAADELADVLEGLLRLARGAIGENQWTLLTKDIDAALKPAEGRGDEA